MKVRKSILLLVAFVFPLCSCEKDAGDNRGDATKITVVIERTTYGIPHISSDNLSGLGFGSGYAQAQDHICVLAEGYVKVNGERSKYFGPDGEIDSDNANIISDFGYKALGLKEYAILNYSRLSEESKDLISGFASGYNFYLDKMTSGIQKLPKECAESAWVRPVSPADVLAYLLSLSIVASSEQFVDGIYNAQPYDEIGSPPDPSSSRQANTKLVRGKLFPSERSTIFPPKMNDLKLGSNGWALGKETTQNGKGILLANPHYPLYGNLKFWQSHAIVRGDLDVAGASLLGLPGVIGIGFNKDIAWTHTVSSSERLVIYKLMLNHSNKEEYIFNGETKRVQKRALVIDVLVDGNVKKVTRDFFTTELGPVIEYEQIMPWSESSVYVLKDAALHNLEIVDHWLAINRANDVDSFKKTFIDYDGIAFLNTIYADKNGNSFYIDDSNVPKLSEDAINFLKNDQLASSIRKEFGISIIPGSESGMVFDTIETYSSAPKLQRFDYVQNTNDSYWATNPNELIDEHSPLYGVIQSPLSLRARMSLKMLDDSRGEDGLFNIEETEAALLSNRSYLAELILGQLLTQCFFQGVKPVQLNSEVSVNISDGCMVLGEWDRRQNKDSIGGHLFREWASLFYYDSENSDLFEVPFNANDPKNTPRGLKQNGLAMEYLARAVLNLQASGIPLDARMGQVQFFEQPVIDDFGNISYDKLSWAGAANEEGGFNIFQASDMSISSSERYLPVLDVITGAPLYSGLTSAGYPVRFGSSWMMIVGFNDEGPEAVGLMSYSQSSNLSSADSRSQSDIYSEKMSLVPIHYSRVEIEENLVSKEEISGTVYKYQ